MSEQSIKNKKNVKNLLLWGESGSGKTSLLAAAMFQAGAAKDLPCIDYNDADSQWEKLHSVWNTLSSNQVVTGTSQDFYTVKTRLKPNNQMIDEIIFHDMKGGLVQDLASKETIETIKMMDGILFVVSWNNITQDLSAVSSLINNLSHIPFGLAFTKCEAYLDLNSDAEAWSTRSQWWAQPKFSQFTPYTNLFSQFKDNAIWATSVYGYDSMFNTRPATLLSEYGFVFPFQIQPLNVRTPFRWFLEQWGLL